MKHLIAASALLLAACAGMNGASSAGSRVDFEHDTLGEKPARLRVPENGWDVRVERGGATAASRRCVRMERDSGDHATPGRLDRTIGAKPYRGKLVRLHAAVRVADGASSDSSIALAIRVDRPHGARGLNDKMEDAPISAAAWTDVAITGGISFDADTITFGVLASGPGPFLADDIALDVVREMTPSDPPLVDQLSQRQLTNPDVQIVHIRSDLLSRFWGRDVFMDAGVVVPPASRPNENLAACYEIHGFGGSYFAAYSSGAKIQHEMKSSDYPRMLYVYLQAMCPQGHHEFADSVNNGPWGEALVSELIPTIEKRFLGDHAPSARFLTGHSSGGWSSLWLQVTYPHLFDGTWSTAPDPVDFRDFSGVDIYASKSAYVDERGRPIPLVRRDDGSEVSFRQYAQDEAEKQPVGGQMWSFDAVFSPRGDDGRPMPLFDRDTGAIDPFVARAWRKYDIGANLRERWDVLGPKLAGKIHVWCGTLDTFHLEGAVELLKADLARLGSDADVLLVDGRNHADLSAPHPDLWPKGMKARIHADMTARAEMLTRR